MFVVGLVGFVFVCAGRTILCDCCFCLFMTVLLGASMWVPPCCLGFLSWCGEPFLLCVFVIALSLSLSLFSIFPFLTLSLSLSLSLVHVCLPSFSLLVLCCVFYLGVGVPCVICSSISVVGTPPRSKSMESWWGDPSFLLCVWGVQWEILT